MLTKTLIYAQPTLLKLAPINAILLPTVLVFVDHPAHQAMKESPAVVITLEQPPQAILRIQQAHGLNF